MPHRPSQLVLPLDTPAALERADFIVGAGNAQAVAFIDSWPRWPVSAAVLYGPAGSGKTHLATIWRARSGARMAAAATLQDAPAGPLVVEDVDSAPASEERDARLFRLIERASPETPLLLTGLEAPAGWPAVLPDLASRFLAILSLPLWAPDEALLAGLARKLLADRQLAVPDAVIARIVHGLERTPGAVRAFIADADAKALSEARPINLALVRELLAERDGGLS